MWGQMNDYQKWNGDEQKRAIGDFQPAVYDDDN